MRKGENKLSMSGLARSGATGDCGVNMAEVAKDGHEHAPRKYVWPWFVLGAVLLGIALSILWMSYEVNRTRRIRDLNAPQSQTPIQTNSASPSK